MQFRSLSLVPEFKLVFYKVIVCPFRGDQGGMVA